MNVKFNIDSLSVKKVANYINKKSILATKQMSEGLAKASIYVQGEVKSSIAGQRDETKSVDTGRFLNSVGIDIKKDDAIVYSNLSYAKFLEYGTSRFPGRKHFQNSKNRSKNKIKQLIDKSIKL